MSRYLILVALALSGCLSRTDVGFESRIDAGLDASGVDDGAVPSDDEIAVFESRLFGVWEGDIRSSRGSTEVHFEFRSDHTILGCLGDACFINGEYRVTDVLLDGSGIVQGRKRDGMPFALTDVVVRRDTISFRTSINALPVEFELERVGPGSP